jgi:hypothetical protein
MKCNEFQEKFADLFDVNSSPAMSSEMFSHIEGCQDCRELYEQGMKVMEELRPREEVGATPAFSHQVIERARLSGDPFKSRSGRNTSRFTSGWKKVTAIAAVLAVLFILIPLILHKGAFQSKADAANVILDKSITAMNAVHSMVIEFNVRTLEGDNFDYINMRENFVEHKLWKEFGKTPKWRIEKPARVIVMDGGNQYLYCNTGDLALKAGPDAGFLGWMRILLEPGDILQKEKSNAGQNGSKYNISEKGNTISMTITAKAMGDFSNAYLLNTSIPESNNSRVYTFDKATHLLKTFEVFVDSAGEQIKVLDLKSIRYNEPIDEHNFTIQLPENMSWVSVNELEKQVGVKGGTSEDVARQFFTACHSEDWSTVKKYIPGFLNFLQLQVEVKSQYGGLTVISIGKSFKSGQYPGEFVPYEVKLKSGYVKKWNLAVRNDNPEKKWMVDGGF